MFVFTIIMQLDRRRIISCAVIVELLGQSARASWSSRSWYYMFVFTIMQFDRKQKENHIFCCHSRAAWPEKCEGLLELASLVVVAARMGK